jgi:peptidoglycan/xylan/chitin deacetylase (PgdA/CDA1 family)
MKIRYIIAGSIFGRLFLKLIKKRNMDNDNLLKVLIYHDIPCLDFDKFESQLKFIAKEYGFIRPDDLENILSGKVRYKGTKVLLTFDDGFRSNALAAEKILEPLGIKAIFFVSTGFINAADRETQKLFIKERFCYDHFASEGIPDEMTPMSWYDLKSLLKKGHMIGAHTINHRLLTEVESEETLRFEIIECGRLLQEKLDVAIEHFSFPFGDIESINHRAMEIVKGRYKYCYSGVRGNNSVLTPPHAILRDSVTPDDPISYIRFMIEDGLGLMYKKRASKLMRL